VSGGCLNHLNLVTLAEYWLGNAQDNALEEHLLSCSECSAELEWIARVAKGITAVARRGNLGWVATPEFLARLIHEGLRVRSYAPPITGGVQCTVTPEDDLLMGCLRADLSKVPRLDIILTGGAGEPRGRLEDVPFRAMPEAELVLNEPVDRARATVKDVLKVQLVSVEPTGDRVIGEYTFNHSVPAK
jgi:hypothetical protein